MGVQVVKSGDESIHIEAARFAFMKSQRFSVISFMSVQIPVRKMVAVHAEWDGLISFSDTIDHQAQDFREDSLTPAGRPSDPDQSAPRFCLLQTD